MELRSRRQGNEVSYECHDEQSLRVSLVSLSHPNCARIRGNAPHSQLHSTGQNPRVAISWRIAWTNDMPGKANGLRHEEFKHHRGRQRTYRHCPGDLALSRYEGVLIVEVQYKLPTGARLRTVRSTCEERTRRLTSRGRRRHGQA